MPLVVSEGFIEPIHDVSLDPGFNGVIGFSRGDVSDAIDKCTTYSAGTAGHTAIAEALAQRWGGGYLFNSNLPAADGMFSPTTVADLLDVVHGVQATDSLADVLAAWVSSPLRVEPNRAIVGYFAIGHSLLPLMRQLASTPCIDAPEELAFLRAEDQVDAATGRIVATKMDAIASTLYYEGMLTHVVAAVAGDDAGPRLRVVNEQLAPFLLAYVTELRNTPY